MKPKVETHKRWGLSEICLALNYSFLSFLLGVATKVLIKPISSGQAGLKLGI